MIPVPDFAAASDVSIRNFVDFFLPRLLCSLLPGFFFCIPDVCFSYIHTKYYTHMCVLYVHSYKIPLVVVVSRSIQFSSQQRSPLPSSLESDVGDGGNIFSHLSMCAVLHSCPATKTREWLVVKRRRRRTETIDIPPPPFLSPRTNAQAPDQQQKFLNYVFGKTLKR